jgi:deoxyadenosine/deoxycytidine kinase
MPRVVIDGNIGAGKTTQLDLLEAKGWKVRREPIDKWPLEEFYSDPSRWAFLFHMRILQTRAASNTKFPIIYERSLQSSYYVFWEILRKKGQVTDMEHDAYTYFYEKLGWQPDLYIFLSKTPELAYEHVQTRHQAGDGGVTLEYMKELNEAYMKLVRNMPCIVRVVNANRSVDEIHKDICKILAENEQLLVSDTQRDQVQKNRTARGGPMQCTSFINMCRLS